MLISKCSEAKYIGKSFISVVTYKGWAWDIRVQFGRKSVVNNMNGRGGTIGTGAIDGVVGFG
jgi:hypothetical protein